MSASIRIGDHVIGDGAPCFIIAEAGVNHNGDIGMAMRLIDVAAEAGADAVKFQTFRADRLATPAAPKAAYQKQTTAGDESQYAMLKRLELDAEAHVQLIHHCATRRITFLSTPFDEESADLLERLGVPAFKIPSGEIVNLPFLQFVAAKGRPIILSTGMSDLDEVSAAVDAIRQAGGPPLAVLHCVSEYPADPGEANLRAMAAIAAACRVPVGFSDHTEGIAVSLAAVALGAAIIEKHFTLDRSLPGPDHRASLEPAELAAMNNGIRAVSRALGDGIKRPQPGEAGNRLVIRKSLVAAGDLPAGAVLRASDLLALRPGQGLSPAFASRLIGRRLTQPVAAGSLLTWEMVEPYEPTSSD